MGLVDVSQRSFPPPHLISRVSQRLILTYICKIRRSLHTNISCVSRLICKDLLPCTGDSFPFVRDDPCTLESLKIERKRMRSAFKVSYLIYHPSNDSRFLCQALSILTNLLLVIITIILLNTHAIISTLVIVYIH